MDNNNLYWVFCLALLLVAGLNLMIFLMFKGTKKESMADVLRRFSKNVPNPWVSEDTALSELSERVADLKSRDNTDQEADQ